MSLPGSRSSFKDITLRNVTAAGGSSSRTQPWPRTSHNQQSFDRTISSWSGSHRVKRIFRILRLDGGHVGGNLLLTGAKG